MALLTALVALYKIALKGTSFGILYWQILLWCPTLILGCICISLGVLVGCFVGDVCIVDTVGMTHRTTIVTLGLWVVQLRRAAPLNSSSASTVLLLCMNHPLAPV